MTKMKKKVDFVKKGFYLSNFIPGFFLVWWEDQRYFLSIIIDEIDTYHTRIIKKKLPLI